MELVIATRNAGKTAEFSAMLPDSISCIGLESWPDAPLIEEDASTFTGNAVKKAMLTAIFTRHWTMADDSGLEVEALDNAPGVRSARYAGEKAGDLANNLKLLQALQGVQNRSARFACVLALASPQGHTQIVEGYCRGVISTELRGTSGFGYDPLFIPEGHSQTLAELGPDVKNSISHRAAALRQALKDWERVLDGSFTDWPTR